MDALNSSTPFTYLPGFIKSADQVASILWDELDWERRDGAPRFEYYCNEIDTPYTYGRGDGVRTYQPKPWHPAILSMKKQLEEFTGSKFEVCFLNGYRDQKDQLGWHADDSPEMDDNRPIAIISLGVEREIWFKKNGEELKGLDDVTRLKLGNGSLCLMAPGMQDTHLHRIPKAGFECGFRISLTFRGYVEA